MHWAIFIQIGIPALLLSACAPSLPSGAPPPPPGNGISNKWGAYSGPIRVEFLHPRNMKVLERVQFNDPTGRRWVAKPDDQFNGASIPQAVWSIIGGPFDDAYRDASLFHDLAYQRKTSRWQDADRMFYYSVRCSGVAEWKAKLMFTAVWKGSTKWPEPRSANATTFDSKALIRPRPIPVEQLTRDDVKALENWIKTENPTLEEIEAKFAPTESGAPPIQDVKSLIAE